MILAHAVDQSGPHYEVLIVAGAFFLLGVIFFVQKSVKPVVSVALVVVAAAMATGAFAVGDAPPEPEGRRVVLRDPKPGDVVPAGEPIPLDVAVMGAKLASSGTATDGGHLHVEVDGAIKNMPAGDQTPTVDPLEPGRHELTVELVDYRHAPFEPRVRDTIEIRVE